MAVVQAGAGARWETAELRCRLPATGTSPMAEGGWRASGTIKAARSPEPHEDDNEPDPTLPPRGHRFLGELHVEGTTVHGTRPLCLIRAIWLPSSTVVLVFVSWSKPPFQ